jgi:hypothetical protein
MNCLRKSPAQNDIDLGTAGIYGYDFTHIHEGRGSIFAECRLLLKDMKQDFQDFRPREGQVHN